MISVIVPAKDAASTLSLCLSALRDQDGYAFGRDYEVIVVDDGSRDATAALARQAGVQVLSQPTLGPAAARNLGARVAVGEILAFTDADCAPAPTWLGLLTRPFQASDVVGVKGAYRTAQPELVARFVQLEYDYKYLHMRRLANIDFIDTNNAAYRRDIFLQNDGFNETFIVPSVEDQEFSFRLARKGYLMLFEPDAIVYHQHDRSLVEYLRRKFGIGYWKAYMLGWTPEKALSDSHTAPTQRIEIGLLALWLFSLALLPLTPVYAGLACLLILLAFLVTISPFLVYIARTDPKVLLVAPGLLVARAAALGAGLVKGFLFPPRAAPAKLPCQAMHVRLVKRVLDILGSGIGLVLSLPVIAVSALAIRLDSPGPAFYRQRRAGENGRPFSMLKLRTMVVGADGLVAGLAAHNELKGPAFKLQNDPRVTRVGRSLRRWSLDELPQFWNVLMGDMSLVGPRPEELRIVDLYSDAQRVRLIVKPGMTGPMQVSGRGELDFEQRLQLELSYLQGVFIEKGPGHSAPDLQGGPERGGGAVRTRQWIVLLVACAILVIGIFLDDGRSSSVSPHRLGSEKSAEVLQDQSLRACDPTPGEYAGPLVPTPPAEIAHSRPSGEVQPLPPETARSARLGFSVSTPADPAYWASLLGAGWYLDWRAQAPAGDSRLEYWPMVRVHASCISPGVQEIRRIAAQYPGLVWLIGNEPDVIWQDNVAPARYARVYHDLYALIKAQDPTAQVAAGGISQATPLRLAYLDQVLEAYEKEYLERMPVDWWNVHGYVLREEQGSWGVDIPPGIPATQGELREVSDHGQLDLFEAQLVDFRQWMARNGYQGTPLALTEFGILMPASYGFPVESVTGYLEDTFSWLSEARDETIGYPLDDHHLVQKWAWFSLSDPLYPTSDLGLLESGSLTPVGESFRGMLPATSP